MVLSLFAANCSSAVEPDGAMLRTVRTRGSIMAEGQPEAAARLQLRPALGTVQNRFGATTHGRYSMVRTTRLWNLLKQRVYGLETQLLLRASSTDSQCQVATSRDNPLHAK